MNNKIQKVSQKLALETFADYSHSCKIEINSKLTAIVVLFYFQDCGEDYRNDGRGTPGRGFCYGL